MITIKVEKNIVSVQETEILVSGSVQPYKCQFLFDDSWDTFFRSAVFRTGSLVTTVPLDADDTCVIPWEHVARDKVGLLVEVSVYGVSAEVENLPTIWDKLGRIRKGTEPGPDAASPSPGVYDRVISIVKSYGNEIDEKLELVEGAVAEAEAAARAAANSVAQLGTSAADAKASAEAAEKAKLAVENMTVEAERLPTGADPTVSKEVVDDVINLVFGIPAGIAGTSIVSITETSREDKPDGSCEITYTITMSDGTTSEFIISGGATGPAGVGIASVQQTYTASSDGGLNEVTVTLTDGASSVFTVANGRKGDPFTVAKTYATIADMNADFSTSAIAEGSFVAISSTPEDEDNAKLYIKGATGYTFVTDMSGMQGIKGDPGVGIAGINRTAGNGAPGTTDTYTITMTDGSTVTVPVYNGNEGVGIAGIARTSGSGAPGTTDTYTITLTDGSAVAVPVYNGSDGIDGIDGATPHVGSNGNWFIGSTDTGVRANGQSSSTIKTVTLAAADWANLGQMVSCAGILADETTQIVTVFPAIASRAAYMDAGVVCVASLHNMLSFAANTAPTEDLTVYVAIEEAGQAPLDVYSTNEQVVGTWVDGKPIYRATIPFVAESIPASTTHETSISIPANLETAIRISGAVSIDAATEFHREINDGCFQMWCDTTLNKFQVFCTWSSYTHTYSGYIICEYTKTTDSATIPTASATALMNAYEEGVNEA